MAKLAAYRAKRDFDRTSEPDGSGDAAGGSAFVVQKHDATRLHYDLRLELDGVMKSWAVAKGPSLVPGEKRLAVHVEDHPLAYNTFEGTIPKGQYGGGTVLLWDRGTWRPSGDPHRGYAKGHLDFTLEGEKLRGAWHLVRMRRRPREKQEAWLLIKSEDGEARAETDRDVLEEMPRSVATGRDLDEIAAAPNGEVWDSNRGLAADERAGRRPKARPPTKAKPLTKAKPRAAPRGSGRQGAAEGHGTSSALDTRELTRGGREAPLPRTVEPCLATLADAVPRGAGWLHEIKWDGYRLIASRSPSGTRLTTRRGHDWTTRFPAIAAALDALPVLSVVLDGEAVIEDANGVASFSALQAALGDEGRRVARDAILYAFDLLYLDGVDLTGLPLEERKARLAGLLPAGGAGALRLGEHIDADGEAMIRSACRLGLEGVISKRRDRPYRSGRSDDWLKVKCTERQEFVVVGYVPSSAAARAVGSLVLAYHEEGKLRLAGRSGTGFTADSARALWKKLESLKRASPAVGKRPTAEERRGVVWTEPQLVAEVEFRGWTGDDHLRHAAFKGLREDKSPDEVSPDEVVRERPAEANAAEPAEIAAKSGRSAKLAEPRTAARPRHGSAVVAGVTLTHPDRVLWSDAGVTKQGLAEFYEEIAEHILPQIAERPLSLVRCPGGSEAGCFFQKHSWAGLSDHILRERVRDEGGEEEILYVRDIRGIVALVQAGVLEIHPWGAGVADVERPDRIVMDLDPGEGVPFGSVIAGARELRERLAALGLESFVKTTGGKGLHVVAPLTGRSGWAEVKAFCKSLADTMSADSPDRYLAKATKSARRGLIYVDHLRNGRGATAISAYSTRARPGAPVACPLAWSDLDAPPAPGELRVDTLPSRLGRRGTDPWAAMPAIRQGLPGETKAAARRPPPRGRR